MDATRWAQGFHQEIGIVKPVDQIISSNNTAASTTTRHGTNPVLERKARPQEQLNCPRCNSTNTKFCYYNNYSLTQPRYFCKTCRRYWTEGGSLRNVPVGGGSRKNKKSTFATNNNTATNAKLGSSSSALTNNSKLPDLNPPVIFSNVIQNPKTPKDQDLNLSFSSMQEGPCNMSQYVHEPKIDADQPNPSSAPSYASCNMSALELLRTGIASRGLNNTFMPEPNSLYSSGFPMQDYKPAIGFSLDGFSGRSASISEAQDNSLNGNRILFPFGDHQMKPLANSTQEVDIHQSKSQGNSSNGYWSGMLGAGGGQSW